jgi:cell shape-determining protein MreC
VIELEAENEKYREGAHKAALLEIENARLREVLRCAFNSLKYAQTYVPVDSEDTEDINDTISKLAQALQEPTEEK